VVREGRHRTNRPVGEHLAVVVARRGVVALDRHGDRRVVGAIVVRGSDDHHRSVVVRDHVAGRHRGGRGGGSNAQGGGRDGEPRGGRRRGYGVGGRGGRRHGHQRDQNAHEGRQAPGRRVKIHLTLLSQVVVVQPQAVSADVGGLARGHVDTITENILLSITFVINS